MLKRSVIKAVVIHQCCMTIPIRASYPRSSFSFKLQLEPNRSEVEIWQIVPLTPRQVLQTPTHLQLYSIQRRITYSSCTNYSMFWVRLGPKKYQKIARMYDCTGLSTKCTLIKIGFKNLRTGTVAKFRFC